MKLLAADTMQSSSSTPTPPVQISPCPTFDRCGSCAWSDIPYTEQLARKCAEINAALEKVPGAALCERVIPSPKTERYRNRMDFVIDFKGNVGLREKGKWWRVIDNHPCFLGDAPIEEAFHIIRLWTQSAGLSFFDRKAHHGLLRYGVVRANTAGERLVVIVTSAPTAEEQPLAEEKIRELSTQLDKTSVVWAINHTTGDVSWGDEERIITGTGKLQEQIHGTTFEISPSAFFQTNSYAAPLLVEAVNRACGEVTGKKVLDLFCGTGFFALTTLRSAASVVGVELSEAAVADAKRNAALNVSTAEFHALKAEDFSQWPYTPDVVIIDPPRSGLHPDTLKLLLNHAPPRLVYVSCNFNRLAAELPELLSKYQMINCEAVDMFPHTPHVEVIATFQVRA